MLKKVLCLLFALLLFCTAALADVVVATGSVNVRDLPNRSGEVIASVRKGDSLPYLGETVVDERGVDWFKVEKNGRKGWISSKYAKVRSGDAAGVQKSSMGASHKSGKVAATGKVNLRKTPSLDGKVVTAVSEGTTLTYNGEQSVDERGVTWYAVVYNGQKCWISSRYSKVLSAPAGAQAADAVNELSVYCGASLAQTAAALNLTEYTYDESSEIPDRYTNKAGTLCIAGYGGIAYMEVSTADWTLYGLRVDMSEDALLSAAENNALTLYDGNGTEYFFEHHENGVVDAILAVTMDKSSHVESISWDAYSGY